MYKEAPLNYEIDDLDRQIISILMKDAKIPYTEIAKRLIVSAGTIHVRMKKLEELGIAKSSVLLVSPKKLGYDISAYLGIHLKTGAIYEGIIEDLMHVPEVVEAYFTTGAYSIFVKIYCVNSNHLFELLNNKIQSIKGVQSTETRICLEESIMRQIEV